MSFLPFSAGGFSLLAAGGIALGTGIIGMSVYRSISPVKITDALSFFSTCWSCQLFSDVIGKMSEILPRIYHAMGAVMIPFLFGLTAIWIAWQILKPYITAGNGNFDGWSLGGKFGTQVAKLLFVVALLAVPLPRMISSAIIEPVFNIGLSMNYSISALDSRSNYATCVIATAIADKASIEEDISKPATVSAFSPRFRHNLTCQIANIHQMTGLGMTVGWTMLNSSFEYRRMHKLMFGIPLFPNIPLMFMGALILVLYLAALLPVPLFFLEIIVKLSMDFVLLPLTLLGWLFKDWKIVSFGKGSVQKTINDVISGVLGLAMTGIFITFSVMVLNAAFGSWQGADVLKQAIEQNDSIMLIDSLMSTAGSKSLITLIMLGIFITMFMSMIPALAKTLFNVTISDKYYQTTKKDLGLMWSGVKKFWKSAKK
ncbi:MAG: hypothetical protein J5608_00855 [Alphaproteobacteria bacterium]|nr:hypothetical protein [Alphaproteobacteria bacterium]